MWSAWFTAIDSPEERLFWPYLISALVIAFLAAAAGRASLRTELFTRALWWHPSARADYALFIVRTVLGALVIAPLLVSSTVIAVKVVLILYAVVGEPLHWPLGSLLTTLSYTAILFASSDASRFVMHKLMHEVSWLWRFHQVHHSAEVMTPVTLYRIHPVEGVLVALRGVLVTGLVGGVFSWLTGGSAVPAEILGVNAVAFTLNLAGSNLRHSHVWISFGPLERIVMSPAQHQLHHSLETGGYKVNYGSFLALWDMLAGTWTPAHVRPAAFGLERTAQNHNAWNVWSMLLGPFRRRRAESSMP